MTLLQKIPYRTLFLQTFLSVVSVLSNLCIFINFKNKVVNLYESVQFDSFKNIIKKKKKVAKKVHP